ncbi:MAG: hypothetical protein ACXADO_07630 [Candidatus Thorarchaeota archaeon]|jgi:HSP20 family molecular chaperone IbpA
MIDNDEFQKMFRKMLEQFFGTFGMPNDGNSIGGLWDEQTQGIRETEMELTHQGSHIERIELDDVVILVVDGCTSDDEMTVRVSSNKATLTIGSRTTEHETPFRIDPKNSSVSCRNGVAEVKLAKADENSSTEDEERVLRNE